jgi:pyridoxine 5-phosphate synthase
VTKLSVNINKIATLRNSRGGNNPSVVQVAKDCERFGADGITVHPRPDERHIRYQDVFDLIEIVKTEFNIEGNPKKGRFFEIVLQTKPTQATLVPDGDNAVTSNQGWDTIENAAYLTEIIAEIKSKGIRTSIFVDPIEKMIEGAAKIGTDRIELYTEAYAHGYLKNPQTAIEPYYRCAVLAHDLGLGINAGHDLSLDNIKFFKENIPGLLEVSIGHALISEALYLGLDNVVNMYLNKLK